MGQLGDFQRPRKHKRDGFTIVEAIVTVTVFSIFLAILFITLAYGFRTFSLAVARSDVTTEARRLVLFLEGELRSSSYFSMYNVNREISSQRRDGLCFVSRLDWSKPDSYDASKASPRWDRYLIYYATTDLPSGRLVRMAVTPVDSPTSPPLIGPFPYSEFAAKTSRYMKDSPEDYKGSDLTNTRVLASKVKSFQVEPIPATQEIEIRTILRQNAIMSRRGDNHREGGTFELYYRIQPLN